MELDEAQAKQAGKSVPYFDKTVSMANSASVLYASEKLKMAGLNRRLMVDCSHGNSEKDHRRQPKAFSACLEQVREGASPIVGLMLESGRLRVEADFARLAVQHDLHAPRVSAGSRSDSRPHAVTRQRGDRQCAGRAME